VGRLRFATTSIARYLIFATMSSAGRKSSRKCVASKRTEILAERNELQKPGATLTPAEVVELLDDIHRSAKKLVNRLGQLQEYSHSLADPAAPLRQPHLAYLDEFISQAAAGYLASEVNQDPQHMARVFFGKQSLMQRLIDIEVAACEAMKRADVGLLKRKRGQADPSHTTSFGKVPRFGEA
jgi:hypothetical protein